MRLPAWCVGISLGAMVGVTSVCCQQAVAPSAHGTRVVMLGTGTPYPDPARSGPALAVLVNGTPYLVDCGPGVVRRMVEARQRGVAGLGPQAVRTVFITHLHTDHTVGYPDVIFTPAVVGRKGGLEVYGPAGLGEMTASLLHAWQKDIDIRLHGLEKGNPAAYVVHPHDIQPGVVFHDANVTVTAFLVKHGTWDQAFGYRFDTPDRSVVVSGDTAPAESVVKACHGCDVLVHEVYPEAGLQTQRPEDREYHRRFHTSTVELARLAAEAKPRKLVLTHVLWWGTTPDQVVAEIRKAGYEGDVVVANDLDVF